MIELLILATQDGLPTATLLLTSLGRSDVIVAYPITKSRKGNKWRLLSIVAEELVCILSKVLPDSKRLLRWGNRMDLEMHPDTVIYNELVALNKSANKARARKALLEASISAPKLLSPESYSITSSPVIMRPHVHKAGKHFTAIRDQGNFLHQYAQRKHTHYFSEFIDKDSEYRVHCASGKVQSVLQKPRPEDLTQMVWNHGVTADAFTVIPWSAWDITMVKTALEATKVLALDFAAIDIIVKDGVPYVLEANSAPSLITTEYMTGKYVQYINWILLSEEKQPHFKYEEFKKLTSFAFKTFNYEGRDPNKIQQTTVASS